MGGLLALLQLRWLAIQQLKHPLAGPQGLQTKPLILHLRLRTFQCSATPKINASASQGGSRLFGAAGEIQQLKNPLAGSQGLHPANKQCICVSGLLKAVRRCG